MLSENSAYILPELALIRCNTATCTAFLTVSRYFYYLVIRFYFEQRTIDLCLAH